MNLQSLWASVWGRRAIYVLGGVGLVLFGVAIGRFTFAPKVTTKTETKTDIKYVDRWHTVVVKEKAKDRVVHRVVVVAPTPAGPVTTTTTDAHTITHTDTHTDTTKTDSGTDKSDVKSISITDSRPQWRVGAMGGVLIVPNQQPSWLVGPSVERRIAGPVWLGLWGVGGPKGGAVGGQLHVEF